MIVFYKWLEYEDKENPEGWLPGSLLRTIMFSLGAT